MASYTRLSHDRACELPVLLRKVNVARKRLSQERSATSAFYPQAVQARLALLVALEAYEAALTATGWPVPYRLRDELSLYRLLGGSGRTSRTE